MRSKRPFFLVFLVPSVLLGALFLAALGSVLQYSVRRFIPGSLDVGGFTLENFAQLAKPIYAWVIFDTFLISFITAAVTLVLSYPVAYALVRARKDWIRTVLVILAITPLFNGEIVRTYSWMLVLGTDGFVNNVLMKLGLLSEPLQLMYTKLGVIIALVQYSMPVMIILLATAISHISLDYQKAAANLGAPPIRTFLSVTLPLSMPGIIAGFMVIFAWTMSAFSTPQLIGGGKVLMISNVVYLQGLSSFNFPFAAAMSLVALVAAVGSLGLLRPVITAVEKRVSAR